MSARRILKFTLQEHGRAIQPLPAGARIVSVADQCGALQMWAECDESAPLESRTIVVVFTGFDLVPDRGRYIGTALSDGGNIVRHVYEVEADSTGSKA